MEFENPNHVGRFIEIEGVKVFYRSAGAGHPILLLHGFPTSSYDWRELVSPLSEYGQVIAPDLYGFGYSDMPEPLDLEGFLPGFPSAMSIQGLTFAGYDAGGVLGLLYATQHPGSVRRLILMNTTAYPDWVAHARRSSDYAPMRLVMKYSLARRLALLMLRPKRVRRLLDPSSRGDIPKEALEQQRFFIKRGLKTLAGIRPRPYTEAAFKESETSLSRLAGKVQGLKIPTLIIFGREDPYFPPGTPEHLNRDIQGSELHLLDGTGHFALEEKPIDVLNIIRSFLHDTPP